MLLNASNYVHTLHIGHGFGNQIHGLHHVSKWIYTGNVPHYFQFMYRMFGHVSIHDHNTTYPIDQTLVETSVIAIGETENEKLYC